MAECCGSAGPFGVWARQGFATLTACGLHTQVRCWSFSSAEQL